MIEAAGRLSGMYAFCLQLFSRHLVQLVFFVRVYTRSMFLHKAVGESALVDHIALVFVAPGPLCDLVHIGGVGRTSTDGFTTWSGLILCQA